MSHDFATSLARSHAQANAPWWERVYRLAFRNFASSTSVRDDGWAQRGGIDRVVILASGKHLWIDEKVREKDYPDVLLERWSDRDRKSPGWIQKELACDYIAYAFVPTQRCYLLPFQELRRVWLNNGKEWIDLAEKERIGFRIVLANNGSYVTESVAVPTEILLSKITESLSVCWKE